MSEKEKELGIVTGVLGLKLAAAMPMDAKPDDQITLTLTSKEIGLVMAMIVTTMQLLSGQE